MITQSDPELRDKMDLLETSSEHLVQMMSIARESHEDEGAKLFYSHVALYCLQFRLYVERVRQNFCRPEGGIIDSAVQLLGLLVSESSIRGSLGNSATTEDGLRALSLHWNEVRVQDNSTKASFVRQWLGISEERRRGLEYALEGCADKLPRKTYRYSYNEPKDMIITPDVSEHSETVWRAAQSTFDALLKSKSCSCTDAHGIEAKLELGTHKAPKELSRGQANVMSASKYKRKTSKTDDHVEELEFGISLSMGNDCWQEICVRSAKEGTSESASKSEELLPPSGNSRYSSAPVENLCRSVAKMESKALQRLVLRLAGGRLFELAIEKNKTRVGKDVQPISLSRCLEDKQVFFTEKTNRVLSLILGYMVLHLDDTSWLKPGWSSASIQFSQSTSRKTPLRPFIRSQLSDLRLVADDNLGESDLLSDLNSNHRCPGLISLAVILIELHFSKTFKRLAEMRDVQLIEASHGRILLVDVDEVFNEDKETGLEGLRSQMPQNTPLLAAIDNCLDVSLWEDDEGAPLDSALLSSRIYGHVVRLLEIHLTRDFTDISLDRIDECARNMDLGRWGQNMMLKPDYDASSALPDNLLPTPTLYAGDHVKLHALRSSVSTGLVGCHRSHSPSTTSMSVIDNSSNSKTRLASCQFFDDMRSRRDFEKYEVWKSRYNSVYEMFITGHISYPVRIAILDTGIDLNHEHIFGRDMNVQGKYNCYSETQRNVNDNHGHGTFAASLILDYARDAELYVIKIADKNATPDAKIVAKAINHAVDKWGVDIISMSFGWPSREFDGFDVLEDAIDRAYGMKVLMFAAAANNGGRSGRAYPACSSHVICVHSTDTDGNRSSFSPTAEPNAINIATVGESVTSAWPTLLCHDGERVQTRSGTSYATPIVVGISAFLLHYVRLYLPESEAKILKRKEKMEALLRRCAERGPDYQQRDGYLSVDLSLHSQNLFGQKDREDVRRDIVKILRL